MRARGFRRLGRRTSCPSVGCASVGCTSSRVGLTLVEVLVALAVLGAACASLAALQLASLRSGRVSQERHRAAAILADELVSQRLLAGVAPGACVTGPFPAGWECESRRTCLPVPAGCALTAIVVTVTPPEGAPLEGRTVTRALGMGPP